MCRNIVPLYNIEPAASESDARNAALQYVRKVSGYRKPSKANEAAFDRAVDEGRVSAGSLVMFAGFAHAGDFAAAAAACWGGR